MGQPTWPAYAALAALALVLSGCGDDESGTIPETSSTGASTSFLGTTTTTGPRAPAVRTSQSDAQFLMSATFGPTRRSLAQLEPTSRLAWLQAQQELPASLLRARYRRFANPRQLEARLPGKVRGPCQPGARWQQMVFDHDDIGKSVWTMGSKIYVAEELRSEVDPGYAKNGLKAPENCSSKEQSWWATRGRSCQSMSNKWRCGSEEWLREKYCQQECWDLGFGYEGDDCSAGWPALQLEGMVCDVRHAAAVGDLLLLGRGGCADLVAMRNPAVWRSGLADSGGQFETLRPGVLVLEEPPESCDWRDFIQVEGLHYRADPRLQLLDASQASQACVPVPLSPLNAAGCEIAVGRGCAVATGRGTELVLNASSLQQIYAQTQRYVYSVVGLRVEASPCGGLSRWQRCDSCALSTGFQVAEIVAALESKATEPYRDVVLACSGVPAGAVVAAAGGRFRHVHGREGDVFDFSTWAPRLPGGAENIRKWTASHVLQYPSSHAMEDFETRVSDRTLQYVGRLNEAVSFNSLPTALQTESLALSLGGTVANLSLACASPGEVANEPEWGNNMPFWMSFQSFSEGEEDTDFDFPSRDYDKRAYYARTNAWINHVMSAEDQLRQRVAWALSQILVVGTQGFNYHFQFELWMNYYDILVRHAFDNYLDLLLEVTFSPLMGEYLSYMRNSAFDHDQNYPDENYAREVMQLFSIGTVMLNEDGSEKLDERGAPIPSYDNEDIMTFASVFTGLDRQPMRSNIEVVKSSGQGKNIIDHMQMKPEWHDAYPKMGLDGTYLGDRYPLCSQLPRDAFLSEGAIYEFSPVALEGALELSTTSALASALSGGAAKVTLEQSLTCEGTECDGWIWAVKVGEAYYEFVPPKCVHLFFHQGRIATEGGAAWSWASRRSCENPETFAAGSACCEGCSNVRPSSWVELNRFCQNHSERTFQLQCKQNTAWSSRKSCEMRCFLEGQGYGKNCTSDYREDHVCSVYQEKLTYEAAKRNCEKIGMQICDRPTETLSCGYTQGGRVWTQEACSFQLAVDASGKVAGHLDDQMKLNKLRVLWSDGFPEPSSCPCSQTADGCLCPFAVRLTAVFDRIPGAAELQRLHIGAVRPSGAQRSVLGEVIAYSPTGVIDASTVFEFEGKLYLNAESIVQVDRWSFRNPPRFGRHSAPSARSAVWEVEALLEHLVRHPNAPSFVSKQLIQRLVSSNPSAAYLRAVAEAFRSGFYLGVGSGRWGDLKATVTAVLLHPEAEQGQLREPLVKLVHVLRSMEFEDQREVLFEELQELLGQAPFMSPSVFNFYMPDFQPSLLQGTRQVMPEAEIFLATYAVNFLNGILSLVKHQGVTACEGGFGLATESCHQGAFGNFTTQELDLLLTGGRLTERARQVVEQQGNEAQEAIVWSSEFNTLGAPRPSGLHQPAPQMETGAASESYKALINVYLGGGADSFNLVVPIGCGLYDEYQQVRKISAMAANKLLEVTTAGQSCGSFGVHYKLPFLRQLYQEGRAAFVSNIGSLVEPMDKNDYKKSSKSTCVGLFSHSDQSQAAQTLQCQVRGSGPKGVGGRMADALLARGRLRTASYSLNGRKTWAEGFATVQQAVAASGQLPTLQNRSKRELLQELTQETYGNIYCEEYARNIGQHVDNSQYFSEQLQNVSLSTEWLVESGVEGRFSGTLRTVAKIIKSREARQVDRDLFYVELPGFDTHNDAHETVDTLFGYLNDALEALVKELKASELFDKVTLVTSSDFGRTLTSNGKGTDHGWAGQQLVLGGQVKGARVLNAYPESLLEGNNQDVGRGRMIPKYPWENMLVPVAEWMGVDPLDLATVFPNLQNFNSSHILPTSTLFE